uniref:Importin N-terminal domain-containing protein n=1 Tax=Daucus carota subsp. sativus TaxID=79200 RepID=A0A165YIR9_DAUCS
MENLAQLESLCERLYKSQDSVERSHAENALRCFSVDSNYILQCQYILENASTPYALMMASSSLLKQVTDHRLPLQLRLDIRNYVLSYLATRGPKLENFVIGALIHVLCRITKFGWLEDDNFREVVKESMNFLSQSNPVLSMTQQRRVVVSFREQSLLQIFRISLSSLSQLKTDVGSNLQKLALSLALKCLTFDFMGTSVDESSEEFGSIQVPSAWKQVIEDSSTLQIFFDYYALGLPQISRELSEIVSTDCYNDWIRLVAEFTLKSLQSWQWASSSIYHLLELWSKLVTSLRNFKGERPSLLNEYVVEIVQRFISSKFDSFQVELSDDDSENPLDNSELLQEQLECFRHLCRFQYESCCKYISQISDPIMQFYMEATGLESNGVNSNLSLLETKLAWMVHIVAAILRIKSSGESDELHDAELSARVFNLINITDRGFQNQRYSELSKQRLDDAILQFFRHFLKSYIGEQAMESSKRLYARFSELLGVSDHLQVLNVIIGKIATNLKCYAESEDAIAQNLNLFLELASGYTSCKLLLKLDTVQSIIIHSNREHFSFLRDNRFSRTRTTFFYTIGLLVFAEDNNSKFKSSVDPLMQVFVNLEMIPDGMFRTDTVKQALVGLMRDLRGLAMATNSRKTYGLLFDWLYPAHMPLLLKAITYWADTPEVTTPLLKFVAEFVLNKSQRVTFDMTSANGILLFREVSKLLVTYGSRILPLAHHGDIYAFKYKGIWISLTIFSRALAGNYVNFGVFELYGDRALADALDIYIKMILSIPLTDLLAYQKLARAYFAFLEILLKTQITFVLNLDSITFTFIAGTIQAGLRSLDANILSECAYAADYIATYYFNHITSGELPTTPASLNLARLVADCPGLFPEMLKSLFETVLFDDCGNQWTLSRPMLSLMLINEEMFVNLKAQILVTQVVGEQPRLSACFDNLMMGISRNLEAKNRDKFSQNLTRFRNEFRQR